MRPRLKLSDFGGCEMKSFKLGNLVVPNERVEKAAEVITSAASTYQKSRT